MTKLDYISATFNRDYCTLIEKRIKGVSMKFYSKIKQYKRIKKND